MECDARASPVEVSGKQISKPARRSQFPKFNRSGFLTLFLFFSFLRINFLTNFCILQIIVMFFLKKNLKFFVQNYLSEFYRTTKDSAPSGSWNHQQVVIQFVDSCQCYASFRILKYGKYPSQRAHVRTTIVFTYIGLVPFLYVGSKGRLCCQRKRSRAYTRFVSWESLGNYFYTRYLLANITIHHWHPRSHIAHSSWIWCVQWWKITYLYALEMDQEK